MAKDNAQCTIHNAQRKYIDAEMFAKRIEASPAFGNMAFEGELLQRVVLDLLDNAPTADVEEVKHRTWNFMGTEMFADGSYCSSFGCPSCYREVKVCHEYKEEGYRFAKLMYPYCHCGAKMDERTILKQVIK